LEETALHSFLFSGFTVLFVWMLEALKQITNNI